MSTCVGSQEHHKHAKVDGKGNVWVSFVMPAVARRPPRETNVLFLLDQAGEVGKRGL